MKPNIIILFVLAISPSLALNKDCLIHPTEYSKEYVVKSVPQTIPFGLFLSSSEKLIVQIAYKEKDLHKDSDYLVISSDECIIEKLRKGHPIKEQLNCTNISQGWHEANISINQNVLRIGSFLNYSLDHEISYFVTTANNTFNCTDKSPTWNIRETILIKIPLMGQEHVSLILESEEGFSPILHLMGNFIVPLSWNNNSIAISQGTPLPKGNYSISIYIESGKTIFIAHSSTYNCNVSLSNIGDPLDELGISTSNGQFYSILRLDQSLKILPPKEAYMKVLHEEKSDDTQWIIWSFVFGCGAILTTIILIVFILKKKTENILKQNRDVEQQQPLVNSNDHDSRGKVDIEGMTENYAQLIEPKNNVIQTKKLIMKEDHHDSEKKIEKLILGPIDPSVPTKSILILGETGTGKSTTINAMVNYIFGIKLEDEERLILIENNNERKKDNHESQTDFMTAYVFPYKTGMPNCCNYIIVDTPGFGDTRGFERDQNIMLQLENFLNQDYNISHIDAIGFVVNAMTPRLTVSQKYIFDGLFSMFGKDISHNISLLVTFAEDEDLPVLKVLKDADIQYNDHFMLNNESLYCLYNEDDSGELNYRHPEMIKFNWTMSENSLRKFFEKLQKINAVSLTLTKIVLEENTRLRLIVGNLDNQIKEGLNKMTQLNAKYINSTKPEETKLNEQEIRHTEELLVISIKEAQHLTMRLKEIPLRLDPLSVHGYIDLLIDNEQKDMRPNHEERIQILEKLRKENNVLKAVINEEKPPSEGWLHYFQKSKED